MKPISLTLSGWGPYKGEETVDFSDMAEGGLFLITGPTGSGKTTVFDGITYALYGEVSGSIREKDSLRSDFADSQTKTYVSLVFQEGGTIYKVRRNPRYERPKLRGEGVTLEADGGELSSDKALIASGSIQVTAAIEDLLGLDCHQFKQISMIAQGEFQQLLVVSSKDRTQIFRNIFRTKIYDTITSILSARVKELTGRMEEVRHRAEETLLSFRIEDRVWSELISKKQKNYGRISSYVQTHLDRLGEQVKALEQRYKQLDKQYKDCLVSIEEARAKNSAIKRYQEDLKRLETLEAEQRRLLIILEKEKQEYETLPEKRAGLEDKRIRIQHLENKRKLISDWIEKDGFLRKKQEEFLELDAEAKRKKTDYERQDDRYRMASAGILARDLLDGLPCPVCGSLTHPSPAYCQEALPDERELKILKKSYEEAWAKASGTQQEAALLAGAVKALEDAIWPEGRSLAGEEGDSRSVLAGIKRYLSAETEEAAALEKAIIACEREYHESRIELEKAKSAYQQMKSNLSVVEDTTIISMEELENKLAMLEQNRKQLIREKEDAAGKLENNRRAYKTLMIHMVDREAFEKVYGDLREIERAAVGYNNRNLVFEQYVLSVYFDQILKAANKRLSAMTMGRYELYRTAMSKDRRSREGMEMEVLDQYTGKKRSVKTLSGGEAFKAALSLALGSSDVIQSYSGGIQVETLFVDEGFGALDSESLDQALNILASLTGGSRMIGIISHVEELKERLEYQIVVEKGTSGSMIREHVK